MAEAHDHLDFSMDKQGQLDTNLCLSQMRRLFPFLKAPNRQPLQKLTKFLTNSKPCEKKDCDRQYIE